MMDFDIPTNKSANELYAFVDNIPYQNKGDESDNEALHEEPKRHSDDEDEQYNFDEWFGEHMDIHQNGWEFHFKEDNLYQNLDEIWEWD